APPAARLREAGAVFLGKTTMPDFGMLSSGLSSFHGITRNPWHLDRNPGGSSAGAGAAAAAGYGPLHLGTDIGGSVRLPANWCGIFALKPSLGRVPIDPPYMGRVVGPMTRSVEDAARAMGILSQPDRRDHMNLPWQPIEWMQLERSLKGIRIGLLLEVGCGLPVNPEVRTAVEDAARAFAAAGAIVEPMQPWCNEALLHGTDNFWRARAWSDLKNLDADRRANVLPFIRSWAESGAALSGEDVFHAYTQTVNLRAATNFALQPYDYVLSPVSPVSSFAAELPCPTNELPTALDHIGFTAPYNMGEQPAASINCGYTGEGLPIGLQIAGHRFDDLGVLQMARAWEVMRPEQKAWPQVPIR
ncbi:MAG: amidase, partial [Burkholderiales bacterium]|nr:amidase [Burkholderiales bacterium]